MSTDSTPAFEADHLVKSYAGKRGRVLDALNLTVPRGQILGLVGGNGSGKTTLLRTAVGLLRPDSGEVRTLGRRFRDAPPAHKTRVAYVSQTGASPGLISLRETARINALLYPNHDDALLTRLVNRFQLPVDQTFSSLSVGQRQMSLVALAFATRPELVLLDEPAAGLDPVACRRLLTTIAEAVTELDGVTMIMSTHRLQDIERVADAVAVLSEGKIVAHESVEALRTEVRRRQILFAPGAPDRIAIPCALRIRRDPGVWDALVRTHDDAELARLRALPGVTVIEHRVSLEDLFIEYYATPNA